MIKRMFRWSKWCSAALVMLLLLVSLLVGLALFTNLGLNSLVSLAEKAMPQLSVGSAEGALLPKFTLREVRFQDDALHLETSVDELGLAIDMGCFWQGRLCVDDLRLHGLALSLPELAPSQQEPEPESPPLTMISTPLPIAVRNLDLSDIKLDILGNQIDWREFRSGLAMRGDRLTITPTRFNDVNVTLAESEPSSANPPVAEPKQDIVLPEVWIPLTIELQRFDLNRFTLHQATPIEITHLGLELKAAQHQVQVRTLELEMPQVSAQISAQTELRGDYPLELTLKAQLKESELQGQVINLSASQSVANLAVQSDLLGPVQAQVTAELQPLKAQLPFKVDLRQLKSQWPLSGQSEYQVEVASLRANGSLDGYQLALQTHLEGEAIPPLDVDLSGEGSLQHIKLDKLVLATLGGQVSGQVRADWHDTVSWQADLALQDIQPGKKWPQAQGNISGKLSTSGSLTEQGGWQVALPLLDIDGVLRDYPLNIEGDLRIADRQGNGDLNVDTAGLTLSHGPNGITAKGKLDKHWLMDVQVHFPDLSKTLPDVAGRLQGDIALRGELQQPDVSLTLLAEALKWQQQASIEQLSLRGTLTPLPTAQADLRLQARALRYEENQLDSVDLSLTGSELQHQLTLDVLSTLFSTSLAIDGQLSRDKEMVWSGALQRMQASSEQGTWTLANAAKLAANLDTQQFDVSAHCWQQQQSSVCLTHDIRVGEQGEAEIAISQFDFAQIGMFLPQESKLRGQLDATLWANWAAKRAPHVKVALTMPAGELEQSLDETLTIGWDSVMLNAELQDDALRADWQFNIRDNGDVSGQLKVDNVQAKEPQLDGTLALGQFNLDFLAPLIGEYSSLQALISSQLAIRGSAYHPQVFGQVLVDEIQVHGDISPVDVQQGRVELQFNGYDAALNAGIVTPDGELKVDGTANWQDLANWHSKLRVFADELQVNMPPMVHIKLVPDMTIEAKPGLAKISGDLALPWGRIVVEELPPSAVSISKDQVLVNAELQPVESSAPMPINIETDINIRIGDDFKLSAFGLEGGLQGRLNVTQKDKGPFILGEVNIVNGTYRSFGQDLQIQEGKVLMNGPVDQPYVAIKAIRNPNNTQDDVIAGVKVTGPASEPIITIFSEPALPQANALSYLLRGQNIDAESGGGNAMTTALIGLSLAKSGKVVGEIGAAFGVQDLQLDTTGAGDESQVTVSGYIMPGLQVKYGVGIFKPLGEFTVRYRLMKDLYLEGVSGIESAVDLIYQFEFD
ncbi:autotransporter assembly complex protein TamB [Vibrio cidicii]|nr:translocation/assembly module TamB [Vibrio cidicii]